MRLSSSPVGSDAPAVFNNNPVEDVTSDDVACNVGNGGTVATSPIPIAVKAGSRVAVQWNSGVRSHLMIVLTAQSPTDFKPWVGALVMHARFADSSDSHKGPVLTYLAACRGDCSNVKAASKIWFKSTSETRCSRLHDSRSRRPVYVRALGYNPDVDVE